MKKTMVWLALAALTVGCDEDPMPPGGGPVPEDELTFVRFAEGVTLPVRDTSFVVTAGESFELRLFTTDGDEFFEFDLEDESLLRRPDGSPFSEGDTITIHLTIPGEAFIFRFEPSGLVFDPAAPARIEIEYDIADDDFDDDGDVDEDDEEFEGEFALWQQESPGDPWVRLGSVQVEELDEIEAEIHGFTGFALAGN